MKATQLIAAVTALFSANRHQLAEYCPLRSLHEELVPRPGLSYTLAFPTSNVLVEADAARSVLLEFALTAVCNILTSAEWSQKQLVR